MHWLESERNFLNRVSQTYTLDESPQSQVMRQLILQTFAPHMNGGRGLELGCSDGYITEQLAQKLDHLDVVEGSSEFLEKCRTRNLPPNTRLMHCLFEELDLPCQYDRVIASLVLEHVVDPGLLLAKVHQLLLPNGLLLVAVPNARALSRQLALHMGLLSDLKQLTPSDLDHGHRRVYDRASLNQELSDAGFQCIHQGGIMLKLLADFQLDELYCRGILESEHIQGLYSLGLEYPDFCGTLFSICRKKT